MKDNDSKLLEEAYTQINEANISPELAKELESAEQHAEYIARQQGLSPEKTAELKELSKRVAKNEYDAKVKGIPGPGERNVNNILQGLSKERAQEKINKIKQAGSEEEGYKMLFNWVKNDNEINFREFMQIVKGLTNER